MEKVPPSIIKIKQELETYIEPENVPHLKRYFQVKPGGYGEGDRFIGVKIPNLRKIARNYRDLSLVELAFLLKSEIHEYRMIALIILVNRFKLKRNIPYRKQYVEHLNYVLFTAFELR